MIPSGRRAFPGWPIALALIALSTPLAAQSAHRDSVGHVHSVPARMPSDARVASLLAKTRDGAAAFHDRGAAIAAGYRRIGPDVPSMGEHWISPRLVVADSFDVARPALLTYIRIDGRPTLTGVVYAVPLSPGESPPAIFGSEALWHEHNGTLDEEALLPDHHTAPAAATGMRLAILHAWLWSPNPGGMFATDNWAIPFLRLGLSPPDSFPEGAARALSLLSGSEEHFVNVAGRPHAAIVAPLLRKGGETSKMISDRAIARNGVLTHEEVTDLDRAWSDVVAAVETALGAAIASRVSARRLSAAH